MKNANHTLTAMAFNKYFGSLKEGPKDQNDLPDYFLTKIYYRNKRVYIELKNSNKELLAKYKIDNLKACNTYNPEND